MPEHAGDFSLTHQTRPIYFLTNQGIPMRPTFPITIVITNAIGGCRV
jgi:hypothetical protein